MKILVTGGAGFIGSHTVKLMVEKGHQITIYDSLVKGHREAVKETANCQFVKACLSDKELLNHTFKKYNFDAVIHFAGYIETGESMIHPAKFFQNNIVNGLNLLDAMVKNNVQKIVFSSSAAVYKAKETLLTENDEKEPASVYGDTKLIFESILKWYDQIHGIKFAALRYFNAAGAAYGLGEAHEPETHLIPLILQAALGQRENISLFGTNYPTKDGTCVRDYVHVVDLAEAHLLALEKLGEESKIYNIGTGQGYSVKEVIDIVKKITGKDFLVVKSGRRAGDPPFLVANSDKIKKELGWQPQHGIKDIIKSAWEWHRNNPAGFRRQNGK